jgi:hypothetical protein|tara:strand:- start:552 stop:917 length:366 start_codon:yes stop_codon:yes gene_type:complete
LSYFAEIDNNNIVQRVISAEQKFINSGAVGEASKWVQTSYNTRNGKHYSDGSTVSDGEGLRKNYAGVGFTYDVSRDAFYAPQPYPSWTLDDDTCLWNAPATLPDDGKRYGWDEDNLEWKEI